MTETPESPLEVAKQMLRDAGYQVTKVPPCTKQGGHGRHVLRTRSFVCEGAQPIPHGYSDTHLGTFGPWVDCKCGYSFSDYMPDETGATQWRRHVIEHGLAP